MRPHTKEIAGWGNFPRTEAEVFEPADREQLRNLVQSSDRILARGNGKSYGDASLAPVVLSTLRLNRVLGFDAKSGVLECESGALLSDLLKIIVPAGWFFKVTPGIKLITVGGAIASDVHGKNHPTAGCFSNCLISFELMTASGEVKTCSRKENPELFWQSCGGMGWTGVILAAKFTLMKISSEAMLQKTVRADNLEEVFSTFEENRHWPYAAAWVDCTSEHWRGAVFFGEHAESKPIRFNKPYWLNSPINIPFYAPGWLLNSLSIRAHNAFIFNKNSDGERLVGLDKYFYPLDSIQNWNRLYGRRGFVQYQFCLPEENAHDGIRKILETIATSGETPFLTVMKRHGDRPPEALHSFPIRGYSLALDFPHSRGIFDLVKKMDEIVSANEGKIYLTKDACSAPHMGRLAPKAFGEAKFSSLLRERIGG